MIPTKLLRQFCNSFFYHVYNMVDDNVCSYWFEVDYKLFRLLALQFVTFITFSFFLILYKSVLRVVAWDV